MEPGSPERNSNLSDPVSSRQRLESTSEARPVALQRSRRWWWLGWSWRVACASYAVGLLTFLPYALVMIWWSAVLFTPLVVVTLSMTRDRAIARFAVPVAAAALFASIHLLYTGVNQLGLPESKVFLVVWLVGLLGPFAVFVMVSRRLASISRSAP